MADNEQASVKRTLETAESLDHKRSRPDAVVHAMETEAKVEVEGVTREIEAGIIAYISKEAPGFSAIIKHRTHDFMVFEIDDQDRPVHLTDMTTLPVTTKEKSAETSTETPNQTIDVYEQLDGYLGKEACEQLRAMVESKGQNPKEVMAPPVDDKAARATLHQLIRQHLGKDVVSDTQDGAIRIRSLFNVNPSEIRGGIRGRKQGGSLPVSWDEMPGHYCEFLLYKEGKDTMDAIDHICRVTRLHSKVFSYAGTKDRQAVTVQRVVAHKVTADRLLQVNKNRAPVRVGNFRYVKKALRLGDLGGNRFVIVLRDVKGCSEEALKTSLESLGKYGFINYYGTQRFGTGTVSTQRIGASMLRLDWEDATQLLLNSEPGEGHENSRPALARAHWKEHQDPVAAAKLFPNHCVAERALLQHFGRRPENRTDYYGAVMAMPINMRKLYAHGYQSYVWNCAATERIQRYGLNPVVGDLVVDRQGTASIPNNEASSIATDQNDATDTDDAIPDVNGRDRISSVTQVTSDNIHLYKPEDIVLPLPGHRIQYPTNEIGAYIKDLMEKDGLDPYNMERKVDFISLPGSYRRVLGVTRDLQWELLRYDDPKSSLALSDLERLEGHPDIHSSEGRYLAVRLAFTLTPGQYATMALRELMHQDTSPAFQFNLSKLHAQEAASSSNDDDISSTTK
ncbi:pseudouridine synthase [Syncephalis plumigaleata]|nr:pseudouridine synthase [Syncephalis plumigaleata]